MTVYLLWRMFSHMEGLLREEMVAVEQWRVGEASVFPIENKEPAVLDNHVPRGEIGVEG